MADGIFDAAETMVVRKIACGADHKEVADVLVEDEFRRGAGIGATDHNGERMLGFGGGSSGFLNRLAPGFWWRN